MPRTIRGSIALRYCQQHPTTPSLTLAKLMHRTQPGLFPSVDTARDAVRRYRGQKGVKDRADTRETACYQKPGDDRRATGSAAMTAAPAGGMRVLLFDIETTPHKGYFWGAFEQDIHPEQITDYGQILSYAAKWYNQPAVYFARRGRDDRQLTRELGDLISAADIVVAHNGKAFDLKYVWTRMVYYKMPPPLPYKVFDTCLKARRDFNFPHNSLAGLAEYMGLGKKAEHEGFRLWTRCMAGDKDAWTRMEAYNIQDVILLEQVYTRFRAWGQCPNAALYYDDGELRCVCCGAASLRQVTEKDCAKTVSVYDLYRCRQCGKVMRSATRQKREKVMRNV